MPRRHQRALRHDGRIRAPRGADAVLVRSATAAAGKRRSHTKRCAPACADGGAAGCSQRLGEIALGAEIRLVSRPKRNGAHRAALVAYLDGQRRRGIAREPVVDLRADGRDSAPPALPAAAACRGSDWRGCAAPAPARTAPHRRRPATAAAWRNGVTSSSTQIARPMVPTIRSRSCTSRSRHQRVGRLRRNERHWAPSSKDTYTPRSVPAYSSPSRAGSARTTVTY